MNDLDMTDYIPATPDAMREDVKALTITVAQRILNLETDRQHRDYWALSVYEWIEHELLGLLSKWDTLRKDTS